MFLYGSPILQSRTSVWNLISQNMEPRNASWLLISDFNQIELPSHKLGGRRELKGAITYINLRLKNNLIDLHSNGVNFTWKNNREGKDLIIERLDKALCNSQWKSDFPNSTVINLPTPKEEGLISWKVGVYKWTKFNEQFIQSALVKHQAPNLSSFKGD